MFRRHLDTAELSLAALGGADDRTAAHLVACTRCRHEHDRVMKALVADRRAAHDAAADAMATVDFDRQRAAIAQRIARLGAVARVLPFPGASGPVVADGVVAHRRWVMAAAVAGLVLGMVVGRLPGTGFGRATDRVDDAGRVASVEARPTDLAGDDPLLLDVDEVLTRQTRPEFGALDELTPLTDEGR